MRKDIKRRLLSLGLSVMTAATIFIATGVQALAYTETTGTVSQENVKVRASASTTASQVSSLRKGDKIDIVDESTDSSGYVWYKIRVNKSEFGYVRSDLVNKEGGTTAAAPATTTTTTAAALPDTQVTATEEKPATITADSVNVRQGAGTGYDSVGKVTKGDTVTITGEATGTDNKTWYQVRFGNDRTGFIRSDLLEVGEVAAPAENTEGGETGENPEATEGAPEEGEGESSETTGVASEAGDGHYSLVYTPDNEGNNTWYLYDNIEGYRVKVDELIEAAKSSDEVGKLSKKNETYKTVLIVLAVLIAALVIGLILLALKLKDSLYYENEEEEEEYDRYAQPARRRARDDDEEEDRPARRSSEERTVRPSRDDSARPSRDDSARTARPVRRDEEDEERPSRPVRRSAEYDEDRTARRSSEERPARPRRDEYEEDRQPRKTFRDQDQESARAAAPKRKSRNFIGDEDDFEFEFLDLDDEK